MFKLVMLSFLAVFGIEKVSKEPPKPNRQQEQRFFITSEKNIINISGKEYETLLLIENFKKKQ